MHRFVLSLRTLAGVEFFTALMAPVGMACRPVASPEGAEARSVDEAALTAAADKAGRRRGATESGHGPVTLRVSPSLGRNEAAVENRIHARPWRALVIASAGVLDPSRHLALRSRAARGRVRPSFLT